MTTEEYNYPLTACDVVDSRGLIQYRAKRSEWLRLLDGDPLHSISKQLSAMLWNDVAFRCFNEARKFSSSSDPRAAVAPMLAEFLDVGYISTQVLAISKIVERNPRDPNKAIISLRRVVDDIAAHRRLITREMFICHDGLPYDPEPARQRWCAELMARPGSKAAWVSTTGPEGWGNVDMMHQTFDKLSGKTSDMRSRGDLIRTEVLDAIVQGMEQPAIAALLALRHKLLAHAADVNNRPQALAHATLNQISAAHRILSKIAHTVGGTILFESGAGGLPTPQFDQFEHLAEPFIRPADLQMLQTFWDQQSREREHWLLHADQEILEGKLPR